MTAQVIDANGQTVPPPKQRLTASRLSLLRRCPAAHEKRYEQLLERDTDMHYFRMGQAWHYAHELWASSIDEPLVLAAIWDDYDPRYPIERETIIAMLTGYWWYWKDQPLDVIDPELKFDIPLLNPATGRASRLFTLAGKMDGIVKMGAFESDRLAVLERKTTSEDIAPDSQYWLRLRLDPQISQYFIAAQELGYNVQAVMYDVARKPSIKPKQVPILDGDGLKQVFGPDGQRVFNARDGKPRQSADTARDWKLLTREESPDEFGARLLADIYERPEWYFARREIPRLHDDIEVFRRELWQKAKELRLRQRHGWWPREGVSTMLTCQSCAYADLCLQSITVDPNGPPPEGYVRLESAYPELDEKEVASE